MGRPSLSHWYRSDPGHWFPQRPESHNGLFLSARFCRYGNCRPGDAGAPSHHNCLPDAPSSTTKGPIDFRKACQFNTHSSSSSLSAAKPLIDLGIIFIKTARAGHWESLFHLRKAAENTGFRISGKRHGVLPPASRDGASRAP